MKKRKIRMGEEELKRLRRMKRIEEEDEEENVRRRGKLEWEKRS